MTLNFVKMNGAGNDFIVADNREGKIRLGEAQITRLCDRQRGVGADGLILLIPSTTGKADWAWEFFNNDGSKADMCGNGARCFARFVQKVAGAGESITFETGAGIIRANFNGPLVTVQLTAPREMKLDQKVTLSTGTETIHSLNTGVPHAVIYVADADKAMVLNLGREVRNHPHFAPSGTNVNFVQILGPGKIRVRTYERGVEGETFACGTGVTASALVSARLHSMNPPVSVQVQSGEILQVAFDRNGDEFSNVRLTGPADFAFEGRIEV